MVLRNITKKDKICSKITNIADKRHPARAASNCEPGMPVAAPWLLTADRFVNVTNNRITAVVAITCRNRNFIKQMDGFGEHLAGKWNGNDEFLLSWYPTGPRVIYFPLGGPNGALISKVKFI